MKIAVDLDDTLSVVDRITRAQGYIARMGLPYKVRDPDSHKIYEVFDWDKDTATGFIRNGGIAIFTEAEARKGAREVISAWRNAGHEVYVVTARPDRLFVNPEKVSRDWLEKRRIPYDGIAAEIPISEKGTYCREHGIELLVDDNLDACLSAQVAGVNAILLLGRNNAARAHEIKYCCRNWKEIALVSGYLLR